MYFRLEMAFGSSSELRASNASKKRCMKFCCPSWLEGFHSADG
jgi:hypothetical protein